ncbi:MAG: alkene reductase [Calditrichia bacterium]
MTETDILLEPFPLNAKLTLSNRIVMAPMTRSMANDSLVPTIEMANYYRRRADAGLIISEGTIIRPDGQGYPNVPGIFTNAQIEGWKKVTAAVHKAGGKIFVQLWHVGRVSHPVYLGGEKPIAPSAVPLHGPIKRAPHLQYGTPRALKAEEISELVTSYARAAANAIKAGFDGVELHGANGYLIDQFLHYHTNRRNDEYGGTPENMARFALKVVDAVTDKVGNFRTAIRLSPGAYHYIEGDAQDVPVFRYLLKELERREIAYVHEGIFDDTMIFDYLGGRVSEFLRRNFSGTLIGCGSYTAEEAAEAIRERRFDLIAFGRPFIANPDLVEKIRRDIPLKPYKPDMLKSLY